MTTHLTDKTLSLLSLLQMTDSALPIGSYSHSWGLETFVQNGTIKKADDASLAIDNILRFTLAPRDGVGATLAYRFEKSPNRVGNRNSLTTINNFLEASLWASETQEASLNLGQRLLRLAENLGWCKAEDFTVLNGAKNGGVNDTESKYVCHHCVAVGFLGAKLGIDIDQLIPAYLLAGVTALVAALVKLVPLGHTDGQKIISRSQPAIAELSTTCLSATLSDLGGFAPMSEWAAVEHQLLYSRLFQS